MIKIILTHYNSKSFPVLACWKMGDRMKISYSAVYETKIQAINALSGRFGEIEIVDKI